MSAKKQKKSSGNIHPTKPLLSFTWMLILFLLLFILCFIIIFEKKKSLFESGMYKEIVPPIVEGNDPAPLEFDISNYEKNAIQDLREATGDSNSNPRIVSVEPVQWPDTSLGCPIQGMMYSQVITPGFKITIELNGKQYVYHAGLNKTVFCNS